MDMNTDEFFLKFPSVLRKALQSKIVSFDKLPCETSFEPISLYRLITRPIENQKEIKICDRDFYSQIEKNPVPPKGTEAKDYVGEIGQYSCSFSITKEWLINRFHLPKRTKFFIHGTIKDCHGAINRDGAPHVHCWIYNGVSLVNEFTLEN